MKPLKAFYNFDGEREEINIINGENEVVSWLQAFVADDGTRQAEVLIAKLSDQTHERIVDILDIEFSEE